MKSYDTVQEPVSVTGVSPKILQSGMVGPERARLRLFLTGSGLDPIPALTLT